MSPRAIAASAAAEGASYPEDPGARTVEENRTEAAPVPAPSAVDPAPRQTAPRTPPQPREAPRAKKDEEAVFF